MEASNLTHMHWSPISTSNSEEMAIESVILYILIKERNKAGMAKFRKNKNGILMLKMVIEKLQKSLLLGRKNSSELDEFEEEMRESTNLPSDVKEGHFAVIAVDDDELKRFIVPLSYLTHPSFLRLLEQAAEEYGFDHEGALTIPCRPCELERILAEQWVEHSLDSRFLVSSCMKTMLKGC